MTLDDENGTKVERVIRVDKDNIKEHVGDIVIGMIDTLEETIDEAKRLINNDKAIS